MFAKRMFRAILDEDGTTTVEYIIVVGIVLTLAVAVYNLVGIMNNKYDAITNVINSTNVP